MTEANTSQPLQLLVVEDDPDQNQLICQMLDAEGYQATPALDLPSAQQLLKQQRFDIILSDWKLGPDDGLTLLKQVRASDADIGFVMATAYGSIGTAVEAIQAGADDYLSKPFQRQTLLIALEKAAKQHKLKLQNRRLNAALSRQDQLVDLIGHADCMQRVFQRIERVSGTDATVLVTGPSGTGKELAARALHQLSPRANQPFIAINCGAIPESLAEAELFGAEKGAYTGANSVKIGVFEAADGGTLFLDEIGELPLAMQPLLLRALQEGVINRLGSRLSKTVNVRVIAATNRDLAQEVADSNFREDLFYRLNIVPIQMPPLRERREDIGRLLEHFVQLNCQRYKLPRPELPAQVIKQLLDAPWPGNVRELANRVERFVLLGDIQELLQGLHDQGAHSSLFSLPDEGVNWEQFERDCLQQALQRHGGNRTKAAAFLQLPYKAFLYRLEKYDIR
ncbi:sigma-54-dependent transcriptional regulator [Corallincola platygyrae]|uniref:Sigma-54-dependent transcriptional regulator n=1 Tax=Corallincola platygyrae TaxID=1193278 RepID=A0ABW4XMT3_9GAMM